ncbi:MAG: RluA family pseudouridine synthase [bacterium]|nr:RluA family pseudouridine synthase [bacterium]
MKKNNTNNSIINESIVPEDCSGLRIDKYLAKRFTYLSRSQWQKEIRAGRITLNNKEIRNDHKKVMEGDSILYSGREIEEPEIDRNYSILFEDANYMAINKPGNLPVHPAGRYFFNTLTAILEEDFGCKFFPVHRLDRETSGLILMAKNSEAASKIQSSFHRVKKSYIAIVHGSVNSNEFSIDLPIGPAKNALVRKRRAAFPGAEESAATHFKKLLTFGDYTLVKAMPVTGRLHQIRVHLNYAGFPIVGDKIYGLDERFYLEFIEKGLSEELLEKLILPRCALHSRSLLFYHPFLDKDILIKAPVPDDFRDFIES